MTNHPPRRRLSDKLKDAMDHALSQGRKEIAERLGLICQAILDEDPEPARRRRATDRT